MQAYKYYILGLEQYRTGTESGYFQALDLLENAVAEDPAFNLAYAYLILVNYELYLQLARRGSPYQQYYDAVIELYDKAVAGDELSPKLYSIMAEFLTAWGDTRTASSFINKSLLKNPHDSHAWLVRWKLKGDGDPEHPDIVRALELSPRSGEVLLELGNAYRRKNRYPESIYNLNKAYSADPENVRILYALAAVFEELGEYDQAVATYEGLITSFPEEKDALIKIAEHYYYVKDAGESAEFYEKTLQSYPGLIEVRLLLGTVYAYLGRFEDAERVFDDAVRRNPASNFYNQPIGFMRDFLEESADPQKVKALIEYLDETRKAKGAEERANR